MYLYCCGSIILVFGWKYFWNLFHLKNILREKEKKVSNRMTENSSKQKRHQIKSQPKKAYFCQRKCNELLRLYLPIQTKIFTLFYMIFGFCLVLLFSFVFGNYYRCTSERTSEPAATHRPIKDHMHCCMWHKIKLRSSHILSQLLSMGR